MPEDLPDRMPEDMPDRMPEDMPEDMPDHMPEDMPDRMPNRMSEDMSDRMPEDLPVRKCINVMVGITRSKVIFLRRLRTASTAGLQFTCTILCFVFCCLHAATEHWRGPPKVHLDPKMRQTAWRCLRETIKNGMEPFVTPTGFCRVS